MKHYFFHTDPGHGWLAVPVADLEELDIADKITAFSYYDHRRKMAYLEEDCDATLFHDTAPPYCHTPKHTDAYHWIRNLASYSIRQKYHTIEQARSSARQS